MERSDETGTTSFNLNILRDEGKAELLDILESLRGRKCLVLDSHLGVIINQIIPEGSKLLKDYGVLYFRDLKGDLSDFIAETGRDAIPDNIIYLVRPNLAMMKVIAKQVQTCLKLGIRSQYHIYFVPHRTVACEQVLEDERILEHVEIGEFHLGFVPFDTDILSLEMEAVYRQCYVDGDTSSLNAAARALSKVQSLFGIIPNVKSKGAAARKVVQKLLHLRREDENAQSQLQVDRSPLASRREIDTLVVMDREVDLVSPLVTPLTYEGLIDEILSIENGRIKLEASILEDEKTDNSLGGGVGAAAAPAPKYKPGEKVSVALNNSDTIYAEIRDLSIERLGAYLQEKAIRIRESYSSFRENKDASISEIHGFVKKIPQLTQEYKSLNRHINIAELVKQTTDSVEFREQWQGERGMLEGESYLDQIEDIISADTDRTLIFKALRLLCLQSLTSGGIRSNRLDAIRRLVAQTYGFDQLFTLYNLERAGLIKRKDVMLVETTSVWQGLRRTLRLIDDRVDVSKPDDMAYVSAGYAPLSGRLIQMLSTGGGWTGGHANEVMRQLPGPLIEFTQSESVAEELAEAIARSHAESQQGSSSASAMSSFLQAAGGALGRSEGDPSAEDNFFGANRARSSGADSKPVMLVFVVGGLSFLEIAAFRFLSKDPAFPYQIVCATTKLINGSKMLKSLVHEAKA